MSWYFAPSLESAQLLSAPPPSGGGMLKFWTGSAWVAKPLKVWNGSTWETKPVKHWTGSTWQQSNS